MKVHHSSSLLRSTAARSTEITEKSYPAIVVYGALPIKEFSM